VVEVEFSRSASPESFDAALIELDSGVAHEGRLASGSGRSFGQLEGAKSLTRIYLDIRKAKDYGKCGARTGITSGSAGGLISWSEGTFWVSANAGPGDSGGASYEASSGFAGSVNGPRAGTMDNPPQDRSEHEWHQTVFTAYSTIEHRFDIEITPHD